MELFVPPDEMGDAFRIRLGAPLMNDSTLCERCGKVVRRSAVHGLCCSLSEATRGHNTVRDHLLHFFSLADNSASIKVSELIPDAPTLRPADVYSDAIFPCGRAALDVGICSPDNGSAGIDYCESMWKEKRGHYANHSDSMEKLGFRYYPVVFSCYGRVHYGSSITLESIAKQVAKRIGICGY